MAGVNPIKIRQALIFVGILLKALPTKRKISVINDYNDYYNDYYDY